MLKGWHKTLRREYATTGITEKKLARDPLKQFKLWFRQALKAGEPEPNAMFLATCSKGHPSGRVVLLKHFDAEGFVFYTNYQSRKAKELKPGSFASLTFYWPRLHRQVRIEGGVTKVSHRQAQTYFGLRPRGAQIAACISPQSEEISKAELLRRYEEFQKLWVGKKIPCPKNWGGYAVAPNRIEFWQGRPDRLHDRIEYLKKGLRWRLRRLAP